MKVVERVSRGLVIWLLLSLLLKCSVTTLDLFSTYPKVSHGHETGSSTLEVEGRHQV